MQTVFLSSQVAMRRLNICRMASTKSACVASWLRILSVVSAEPSDGDEEKRGRNVEWDDNVRR